MPYMLSMKPLGTAYDLFEGFGPGSFDIIYLIDGRGIIIREAGSFVQNGDFYRPSFSGLFFVMLERGCR